MLLAVVHETPQRRSKLARSAMTSVSTITTTFDTVMVKKCQCTVCAGWLNDDRCEHRQHVFAAAWPHLSRSEALRKFDGDMSTTS